LYDERENRSGRFPRAHRYPFNVVMYKVTLAINISFSRYARLPFTSFFVTPLRTPKTVRSRELSREHVLLRKCSPRTIGNGARFRFFVHPREDDGVLDSTAEAIPACERLVVEQNVSF
jgi:hypothetical protein